MADPVESGKLSLNFGKFFDSESLADVRLTVTAPRNFSRAYHAHRVVLGAASTYFAAQFWRRGRPSCAPSAGGDALFEVRVAVDEEPATRTHSSSSCMAARSSSRSRARTAAPPRQFYGVDALATQCLVFLERVLHPEPTRCFALFRAGSPSEPPRPSDPKLLALCTEVIARAFSEVWAHAEYVEGSLELLGGVLERDDLSVESEEVALRALLRWADHQPEPARDAALLALLELIRWPTIPGEVPAVVEDEQPLRGRSEMRDLLLEAFKYQAAPPSKRYQIAAAAVAAAAKAANDGEGDADTAAAAPAAAAAPVAAASPPRRRQPPIARRRPHPSRLGRGGGVRRRRRRRRRRWRHRWRRW